MRRRRQSLILKLITENDIETQSQLSDKLNEMGCGTTQATISRDIKELGLIKIASRTGGYKYSSPVPINTSEAKNITNFSDVVISIRCAQNNVVVKTFAGMAQAVCASIDTSIGEKIMGSIAGDDTIFILTEDTKSAVDICNELKDMYKN